MKILVFGSYGKVGSEIVKRASECPEHRVVPLVRSDGDITNPFVAGDLIDSYKPDIVINAAAKTGLEACQNDPGEAFAVNSAAVANMAIGCERIGALFIHFSTDCVFFDTSVGVILHESMPTKPCGVYGFTKLAGEQAALQFNLNTWVFRLTTVYGRTFSGPIDAVNQAKQGKGTKAEPIKVLRQFCCPTSARLVADAVLHTINTVERGSWRNVRGVYHLATSSAMWKKDFSEFILKTLYPVSEYVVLEGTLPVPRPVYTALDTTKFTSTFNYELPGCRKDFRETLPMLVV